MRTPILGIVLALGCHREPAPGKPTITITETTVELLSPISFVGDTEAVEPSSLATLDAIASTLATYRDLQVIEVRAFALDVAGPARQEVADRRAHRIVDYLVHKGVAADRLVARGALELDPGLQGHHGEPVFVVLKRAP
jgi:outer membrane protein OmpA-like peptidoglycan-associated protein